jgi:aryl-alcohol dehydrogenase-like predicted oxidoreductase
VVEEVVGTMSDLVKEGKVLDLGLSATDTETVQRASAVHRISFVQNEYSLIQREPEKGLLAHLNDQRIKFATHLSGVGYSGAFPMWKTLVNRLSREGPALRTGTSG